MAIPPDSAETADGLPPKRPVLRMSFRTLKPLAPKPPQAERSGFQRTATPRAISSVSGPSSCTVCPAFRRTACRLSSHKSFVNGCKRAYQPADGVVQTQCRHGGVNDAAYAKSYAYHFGQNSVDSDIAAGRVDPFYKLPIPDSTHPQMHRLFHDFFTVQLDRAISFPRPSCFTGDPIGSVLALAAMVDPAVCLSLIALSATAAGMRLGQQARNPSAQSLYNQASRMLRVRLSNNSWTDETILAATNLFVINVPFEVETAIRQIRKTVRDLVRSRGGPSQLGMGGMLAEYITLAEALAALSLKDEPYVMHEAMPGILRTPPPAVYGAAFSSPHILESLHPTMFEICFTMCRLTEVLEKAIREYATPVEYVYFCSTLKWVSIRRVQFRARYCNSGTKDECISNVIEIFRCNVFSTQPENESLNFGFCSQLQCALVQTNLSSYWGEQIHMLIWALFVVGTIEVEWESRHWFMDLLRRTISHRYANEDWPGTWRQETWEVLRSFLWSELRSASSFATICDTLEQLAQRQAESKNPLFATAKK